jgi:hypothetical protein
MNRTFFTSLLAALVLVAAAVPAGAQPRPGGGPARQRRVIAVEQSSDATTPVDVRSARDIRMRLTEILRDDPPSLAQVLRLDPSLMARGDYLAPYPALASFIAEHPEIARDPAFYLGQPYADSGREDAPSTSSAR